MRADTRFCHALPDRFAGHAHHVIAQLCRLADDGDLEGGLDGADGLDRGRDIDELRGVQGLHVARVLIDGQDVQLHAEALELPVALVGQNAGKFARVAGVEEVLEGGLRADAVGVFPDEEDGVAVGGHEEPALWDRAGEVVQVGVLDDERPVDFRLGQARLQGLDPAVEFLLRRFLHASPGRGARVRGPGDDFPYPIPDTLYPIPCFRIRCRPVP
jgi:hypothetical protein